MVREIDIKKGKIIIPTGELLDMGYYNPEEKQKIFAYIGYMLKAKKWVVSMDGDELTVKRPSQGIDTEININTMDKIQINKTPKSLTIYFEIYYNGECEGSLEYGWKKIKDKEYWRFIVLI